MSERLRAGIVGLGRVASYMEDEVKSDVIVSHAAAYHNTPDIELVAGCDISDQQRRRFCKRWRIAAVYDSVDQMVRNEDLDIISICSPTGMHFENAMAALAGGTRAIFCEKPVCGRLCDADQLVQSCDDAGVVLAVNHIRRWTPIYQRTCQLIEQGQIGALRTGVAYYGGGVANIGTHVFDTLRFLHGDAVRVRALSPYADQTDPDLAGYLEFAAGHGCHLAANDTRDHLLLEFDIVGREGRLRVSLNGGLLEIWQIGASEWHQGAMELQREPICEYVEKGQPMLAACNQIAAIVQQGLDEQPACNGADGLAALEIACALSMSAKHSGTPIELPVADRSCELSARSRGLARG